MDNQNPSNQIPPVEPQGQSVPPTSGTKLTTGIAIIVIAVLATGAYFFFSNRTVAPKVEEVNQTKNQNQPTDDKVADWKTYRNEKYGFEIQIPTDWTVEESVSRNEIVFFSQASRDANAARTLRCKDPKVKAEEALECSRRNEDMYFVNENYGNGTAKKETINSVEWEVLEGENSGWQYQTKQDGKLYHFRLSYLPENKAKLVQFLSTFKFISSTQTQTFEESLFSISMPAGWVAAHGKALNADAKQRFYYEDKNGNYFQVNIDPGGSDFAADSDWRYEVNGDGLSIKEEGNFCGPGDGFCAAGDNKLTIYMLSQSPGTIKINGHDYYFIFGNNIKETGVDLQVFRGIIASFNSFSN